MSETATASWQTIESAPKDTEVLVFTKPWGPIIATYSEEFETWLSRMQVPVSIREDGELPTHWQPLPAPPDGADDADEVSEQKPSQAAA
ncbi:DUF551 domain-containing protein [uncultured Enterovirga sp.]|uniref:DUF551 domain-containing protein n=1 Tax=uncultured Enterovirga sp. TaxID=2026352 RepID=UPI0035C980B4